MPIFCMKCGVCKTNFEYPSPDPTRYSCDACGAGPLVRDYRSERAGFHIPLHMSARNTTSRSDFLPSTKDFESPTDPTGENGMNEWKDTHVLSREI